MIICLNLHFAVVNFLNLTLEGVEINLGPSRFSLDYSEPVGSNSSTEKLCYKETNQVSHHQDHLKYREWTGMQRASNASFSIAYSVIKRASIWESCHLNYILEQGDILFKSVGIGQSNNVDELLIIFKIENFDLNGVNLDHETHLM